MNLMLMGSLRETLALPCGEIARQREIYARQSLCRASTHGKYRTAKSCPAKASLPCASRKVHGKGFAVRRLLRRLPPVSAVRATLPCAATICRARIFAVRPNSLRTAKDASLPSALRPNARQRTLQAHPGQQVAQPLPCVCARQSDQMVLCRAHTHGKGPGIFQVIFVFH